ASSKRLAVAMGLLSPNTSGSSAAEWNVDPSLPTAEPIIPGTPVTIGQRLTEPGPLTRSGAWLSPLRCNSLERLDVHQRVIVVAADPDAHRRRRVVDKDRPHVGVRRHQILVGLPGLGIGPYDAVGTHGGGPDVAVLVDFGAVRVRVGRQLIFREPLCFRIE